MILWSALYVGKDQINGYTLTGMATYYILVKIIDQLFSYEPAKLLAREIRTGDLSNYLAKPLKYYQYLFGYTVGKRLARTTLTLFLVTILFILFPQLVSFSPSLNYFFLFLLSLILAIILVFELTYLLGCLGFWISEVDYFKNAWEQSSNILGGMWVPISFFPQILQQVLDYLPFKYEFYFTVMVFQGKLTLSQIYRGLIIETMWVLGLILVLKYVWEKGISKFESYGN